MKKNTPAARPADAAATAPQTKPAAKPAAPKAATAKASVAKATTAKAATAKAATAKVAAPRAKGPKATAAKTSAGRSPAWERGYAARCQVLGAEYVDRAFAQADDFTLDLQNYLTEHAWGASWARPGLDFRTRSMLNLAMITALNRPHELEIHVRGALRNGLTRDEIKEILLHTAIYCGAPAAIDAFRVARKVLDEQAAKGK